MTLLASRARSDSKYKFAELRWSPTQAMDVVVTVGRKAFRLKVSG